MVRQGNLDAMRYFLEDLCKGWLPSLESIDEVFIAVGQYNQREILDYLLTLPCWVEVYSNLRWTKSGAYRGGHLDLVDYLNQIITFEGVQLHYFIRFLLYLRNCPSYLQRPYPFITSSPSLERAHTNRFSTVVNLELIVIFHREVLKITPWMR